MAKKKAANAASKANTSEKPVVPAGDSKTSPEASTHLIVGVGASSGGLDAFTQLLRALPQAPGLSLVFVQHMAPQHESMLATLLAGATSMPVSQVTDHTPIVENHVYVVPPNRTLRYENGTLALHPRPVNATQYTPINSFFESLAEGLGPRAVGVVLSGSGTDGAEGVQLIKAEGGVVLAQDPASAKFSGMPKAAIATTRVDFVLTPDQIAEELIQLAMQGPVSALIPRKPDDSLRLDEQHREQIFAMLRASHGVDFSQYKLPTIQRRIQRRMVLQRIDSAGHYVKFLQDNPQEITSLFQDIFIHVTRFFREPESFEALSDEIFPAILKGRRADSPVRIWVPGCSTGEEAYSVAMMLTEYLDQQKEIVPIQIFATDISDQAVEKARSGLYAASLVEEISQQRVRRFFLPVDGHYRINKTIRDLCVFARQDLTRDPPFSKLDLILCRNVLIYLGLPVQSRLINIFHYALKPSGYLMLGSAETIGVHADLFSVVDKKHRVYRKKFADTVPEVLFPIPYSPTVSRATARTAEAARSAGSIQTEINRVILDRYAPPGVVINDELRIVHFRGQTGRYIEPASGDASLNLLKMCRDGLLHGLRSAIQLVKKKQTPVRREGLRVKWNGEVLEVAIEVIPLANVSPAGNYLVLFHETKPTDGESPPRKLTAAKSRAAKSLAAKTSTSGEIDRLESELGASREYLQSIIQDLESTNEELQSANEEILSSNEELQSTNEELDTAKEELQSTNEELNTVNEQLHSRNLELATINSDLVNLLNGVRIAIVIIASDLRIRRFTPMAERVLNLIPADIGRPISQIKPNINCPDLEKLILEVIDTVSVQHREVQDSQGRWYSLTIRPYKNVDNRIDGAVLALLDTDEERRSETNMQDAQEYLSIILEVVQDGFVELDAEYRIVRFNSAFCRLLQASESDFPGRAIWEVGRGAWKNDALRQVLESNRLSHPPSCEIDAEFQTDGGELRRFRIQTRWMSANEQRAKRVVLVFTPMFDGSPEKLGHSAA